MPITSFTYAITSHHVVTRHMHCFVTTQYSFLHGCSTMVNNAENLTVTLLTLWLRSHFIHKHWLSGRVHVALLRLFSHMNSCTMPRYAFSNHAGAKQVYRTCGRDGALILYKQTGLLGSNLLGHGTDCRAPAHNVQSFNLEKKGHNFRRLITFS